MSATASITSRLFSAVLLLVGVMTLKLVVLSAE